MLTDIIKKKLNFNFLIGNDLIECKPMITCILFASSTFSFQLWLVHYESYSWTFRELKPSNTLPVTKKKKCLSWHPKDWYTYTLTSPQTWASSETNSRMINKNGLQRHFLPLALLSMLYILHPFVQCGLYGKIESECFLFCFVFLF